MRFAWDETKSVSNLRKHRVSFKTALLVFEDPMYVALFDREVDGEERWHAIGCVDGVVVLLVVHTIEGDEDEVVRIISARKATAAERKEYEDHS